MEKKIDMLTEADLEAVAGGSDFSAKHIRIVNCKKSCNVRSSASDKTDTNIIGQAPVGTTYRFHGWSGSWAQITYTSRTAYVNKKFVQLV